MNIVNIRNAITQHYNNKKQEYFKRKSDRNRERYGKYYHSQQWRTLREQKFISQPVCEVCERRGIITQADDIHHLQIWSKALTEQGKWNLLLNYNNLCSCCKHHHELFHKYMRTHDKDSATIDELIQYEDALNELV